MALTAEQIADLVKAVDPDKGRDRWTNIATTLQQYIAMKRLTKDGRVQRYTGRGVQENVMVDDLGTARNVGLYATDVVAVKDIMATLSIPFRHTTGNWSIDRRELSMDQGSPQKIYDLLLSRKVGARISLAKRMEIDFWAAPLNDDTTPFGVQYWIVKDPTTTPDGAFNGGNPSGFSGGAGSIDSATFTAWKNWTGGYANVTKDDLVRKMRKAYTFIEFEPPVESPDYYSGMDYEIFCNYNVRGKLEEVGENQNENLGRDIASMDGVTTFRAAPLVWVPQLETDTTDPVFFINWKNFAIVVLEDEFLVETSLPPQHPQHTVLRNHLDLSWNTRAHNRRNLAVISK